MKWTYEGYWNAVIGANMTPEKAVYEYDLVPGDFKGLDEWLGEAEVAAWAAGGQTGPLPPEWTEYHQRAAQVLDAASNAE